VESSRTRLEALSGRSSGTIAELALRSIQGSFAEYLRVESDLTFKVPDSLSSRDAASYGIPWMTAAHVMWDRLGLPQPPQKADGSEWVIIYGGSSSAGLFAIQLAKKAGYKVFCRCPVPV
jgi:NADPH:quinone reductase-like Zn-dependent oxidoreductase